MDVEEPCLEWMWRTLYTTGVEDSLHVLAPPILPPDFVRK
jgi:hypothetical protein